MTIKITKDTTKLDEFINDIHQIADESSEVGFFDDQIHPKSGDNLAEIANINNFGGPNPDGVSAPIPSRPFFFYTNIVAQKDVKRELERSYTSFLSTDNESGILKDASQEYKVWLKRMIQDSKLYADNAPKTIAKKGGKNTPLTDTGFLANNIDIRKKVK